jgi:uroporphyrin-3 C-methyltransferase
MTDTEQPAPRPVLSARAPGARWLGPVALMALALSAVATWFAWRGAHHAAQDQAERERAHDTLAHETSRAVREVEAMRASIAALERQIADAGAVNKSLREELLGLGERAKLVEDAVGNLAERNLGGADALRLNEAEALLQLGEQRLTLFSDPAATLAAFKYADAELAAVDDPVFSGVRQTLAAEIAALATADFGDRHGALTELERIASVAPRLRSRVREWQAPASTTTDPGWSSRAGAVLANLVRVRKLDGAQAQMVNPLNLEAARQALLLEVQLAKAALAVGDAARWRDALDAIAQRLAEGFASDDESAREAQTALGALRGRNLVPSLPTVGKALVELRNLRATRALAVPEAGGQAP